MSISLGEQEVHEYKKGTVLKIPFQTKMNIVRNNHEKILELIVVKSPSPKQMPEKK